MILNREREKKDVFLRHLQQGEKKEIFFSPWSSTESERKNFPFFVSNFREREKKIFIFSLCWRSPREKIFSFSLSGKYERKKSEKLFFSLPLDGEGENQCPIIVTVTLSVALFGLWPWMSPYFACHPQCRIIVTVTLILNLSVRLFWLSLSPSVPCYSDCCPHPQVWAVDVIVPLTIIVPLVVKFLEIFEYDTLTFSENFSSSQFWTHRIPTGNTLMLKKFYWRFLYSPNRGE